MSLHFFSETDKKEQIQQELEKIGNINTWWQRYINSFNWLGFQQTHYTKQLTIAMNQLENDISDRIAQHQAHRIEALFTLYDQVNNWSTQHITLQLNSNRNYQLKLLTHWIENELIEALDSVENKTDLKQHYHQRLKQNSLATNRESFIKSHKINPCHSDMQLYQWWMSLSKLKFYQYRSTATCQLDQAIKWYNDSIILDRACAMQDILIAINCWKQEREPHSQRLEAVNFLEQQIQHNIAELESSNDSYTSKWQHTFGLIMYTVQDCWLELADILEFDSLYGLVA